MVLVILIFCTGVNATAIEAMPSENDSFVVMRASGGFNMEVDGNSAVKASSSFPLEVGEIVTIKATYSPFSASVEFGLIAPDGLFYGLNANDGSFDEAIEVNQRGSYTLAVRNNSAETVWVSGVVNY